MAKIKHTKTELKAQRDALARFQRFLPMLQLKKQQLQGEVQSVGREREKKAEERRCRRGELDAWVALFAEPVDIEAYVALREVLMEDENIAGVRVPHVRDVVVDRAPVDLFATPSWLDDAADAVSTLIRLRVEEETLTRRLELLAEELRTTSQRVNLFEKVKIPECRENIRVIKIYLGDEQTASVARGKIAKKRSQVLEAA
jgi:V/A-type H+-transporting ATPase subunit D